jgi:uncharacterized protein (DUF2235 family)
MKRLVICADGTWNERDQVDKKTGKRRPTNVTKVARTVNAATQDGTFQVVGYFDGVGTGPSTDKYTGGAFGTGICENVVSIYRFILYNYVPGDEIFLFGFSRGAFTVRTLIGFMNHVGLLEKDDDYFVPDMFQLYEKGEKFGSPAWNQAFRHTNHCPSPPIRFVGVWDTVGALGAPGYLGQLINGGKYQFHRIELCDFVENAYHALAIDEHRKAFKPSLWERPSGWTGKLEQAWFSGVHSNVGGSYKPDGVANEALHWIVEKAESLGLEFDCQALAHYEPHYETDLENSMTLMYRPLGAIDREIGKHLQHGESLHESVIDRWKGIPAYRPKNLDPKFVQGGLPVARTTRIQRQP